MKHKRKAAIAIDFDGVLYSFKSGWQGHRYMGDPPVDGAIEWLKMLIHSNDVTPSIYSARSWKLFGNRRIRKWLIKHGLVKWEVKQLKFWLRKPTDDFILDDRCRRFRGRFPPINEILNFEPWHGHAVFGDDKCSEKR
jgi:hypothetical protein